MKRLYAVALVCLAVWLALVFHKAEAADLSVYVTCVSEVADDGAAVVWFGYDSSETLDNGGFGYIGNPDFGGELTAGSFPRFAEFHVPSGETALFWADGFSGADYIYAEATFTAIDAVPNCDAAPTTGEPPPLDDAGNVNDPLTNDRANACYAPGFTCVTIDDWERGWYLIRDS